VFYTQEASNHEGNSNSGRWSNQHPCRRQQSVLRLCGPRLPCLWSAIASAGTAPRQTVN
jgi:hypothetical protein